MDSRLLAPQKSQTRSESRTLFVRLHRSHQMDNHSAHDINEHPQDGISKELLSHLYTSSTIEDAARLLGVGVTALKKRCREVGITRWPHRQLQSLNNMIKGLQAMLSPSGDDECIKEAIQQIEQHVTLVVQDPSYEIPKNVFRLRQAQFKDKHNAKRKRSNKESDNDDVSTAEGGSR